MTENVELGRQIRRMKEANMSAFQIARALEIHKTTVYWYINKWKREEYVPVVEEVTAIERHTCPVCHGRSATGEGHASCTGKGRIGQTRNWRRAVA